MNNEETVEVKAAPVMEQPTTSKALDFQKIDALRSHMLLTVDSFVDLIGTSRVSYYGWLKGTKIRDKTAKRIQPLVRKLVVCVAEHNWPNIPGVFMAKQPDRLKMLKELISEIDKKDQQA